jgi:hypothetical protein
VEESSGLWIWQRPIGQGRKQAISVSIVSVILEALLPSTAAVSNQLIPPSIEAAMMPSIPVSAGTGQYLFHLCPWLNCQHRRPTGLIRISGCLKGRGGRFMTGSFPSGRIIRDLRCQEKENNLLVTTGLVEQFG